MDVDGVVADFVYAFREEAQKILHKTFPKENTDWNFEDWGLTAKDQKEIWNHIIWTPDWFFLYLPAQQGAAQNLPYLDSKYELTFISTRVQTAGLPVRRQTQLHLEELGVQNPTVIITKSKGPLARDLQLNVFIDDKPENLEQIHVDSPDTRCFLMDQAYNRTFNPEWVTRVQTLDEFTQEVDKIASNKS